MALIEAIRAGLVSFPAAVLTNAKPGQRIGVVDKSYWAQIGRLPIEVPVAVLWMGNELTARFLFETDDAFTFTGLPDAGEKVIVQAEVVKSLLLQLLHGLEQTLDQLSPRSIVLVSPPPPKSDDAVRAALTADPFFKAILDKHHWSEAEAPIRSFEFRQRLWQVHRMALEDVARRHKVPVLAVLEEAMDDGGALRQEYAAPDVSHASRRYGGLVWQAIAHHFGLATG